MKNNYKLKTKLAVLSAICLLGLSSKAQVSVVASVGTPSGTYPTLNDAFIAINAGTHQGNIGIGLLSSTTETATCVLNSSGAGAALYTGVTISPLADGLTISGASAVGRGVIELNGADNVTIDGDNPNTGGINRNLTIVNTATNTLNFTSVIRVALSTIVTTADNNAVKNCIINGSATGRNNTLAISTSGSENTTYGILVGTGATTVAGGTTAPSAIASVATVVGAGITATSFSVTNNQINACARAISVNASATTVANNLNIQNNLIGSATAGNATTVYGRGISVQGFNNAIIAGNTIQNIEWYAPTAIMGISCGDVSATGINMLIENNYVTNVINKNVGTYGAYGINAAAGNGFIIRNNFISSINSDMTGGAAFSTTFGIFGIRAGAGLNHKVYNNSVNLYGVRPGTATASLLSACLTIVGTGQTGCDVRNNIFANTLTGGTTSIANVCLHLPAGVSTTMSLTVNNNAYYSSTTFTYNGIGQAGTTAGTNFFTAANFNATVITPAANFRSYTSLASAAGTNDNASYASNNAAPYTSTSNLHLNLSSSEIVNVEQKGDATVPVLTDIDGNTRPNLGTTLPDMGADEIVVVVCAGTPTAGAVSGSTAVCTGGNTLLTLTGSSTGTGISYQWASSTTNGGPYSTLLGTTSTQTVAPLIPTYYVVNVLCSFSSSSVTTTQYSVLVNPNPTITVTPSSATYCFPAGAPVALAASGASTYTWSPAAGLSANTGANVNGTPIANTTYTINGADVNGCLSSTTVTITTSQGPTMPLASASPSIICAGSTSQLTGASSVTDSYTVSNIPFAAIATPSSGVTTLCNTGTVVTTLSSGTLDDGGWMNQTIPFAFNYFGVNYTSFAVSSNGFIVPGAGVPSTYTGYANTFPNTLAARPAIGPNYGDLDFRTIGAIEHFVTGTAPNRVFVVNWVGGNFYNAVGAITTQLQLFEGSNIIEMHTTNSSGTNASVEGLQNATGTIAFTAPARNNVTFTVSTADAYRFAPTVPTFAWLPSATLSSSSISNPVASPAASTVYSLTATAGNGCATTNTVNVTVNASPTITVNSGAICSGNSFTMAPSGASTYSYSNGSTVATPTVNSTYTVTGTGANGCVSAAGAISSVTVNALPTVAVNSGAICSGSSFTMTPSGATTYTFSNGSNVATPIANASYTVNGTDANGCVGNAVSTVTVNATPTISVNSGAICAGNNFTITPSGASTYTISGGSSVVSPAITSTYNVTGSAANGCVGNSAISTVTVNATPTISVNSGAICAGNNFTITPSGASTYTISGGSSVVSPAITSTYNVTGSAANGCVGNSAISTVTVNALPSVMAMTANTLICTGTPVNLSAMGATSYTWSSGSNLTTITVSPTITTTYTLTGVNANGCSNSTTITQNVSLCTEIGASTIISNPISIYPNPNNGVFTIELSANAKVIITDALGREFMNTDFNTGNYNVTLNEANGVYFVKVIIGNTQTTKRLVINK
jgi:Secretion system C-terminal sorting domain